MSARIATFSHTSHLVSANMRIQAEYANAQLQVSTGLISDTYDGIAGDSQQLLNLESDYDELNSQVSNAQTAVDRLEFMFDSLGGIIDTAQSFLSDLGAAQTGLSVTSDQIQQSAESTLDQVISILNSQYGDRYIFSGSDLTTEPVDTTSWGGATTPSSSDTSYYQGNDYIASVELSDSFTLDYGVTADDAAIEKLMRSLDLVITTPNDPATLEEALTLLGEALDEVAVLKASVAQDSDAVTEAINRNEEQMTLLETTIGNLKEVDLAEASVRLQEYATLLEVSYTVTTDILDLSLVDYL